MKKKYEKPKMKIVTVELNRHTLLNGSFWDPDYTAGFNHEPGGQDDFD